MAVICREIEAADLPVVQALLTEGFPARAPGYWARGLARLAEFNERLGVSRFGALLAGDGAPQGVLLLLHGTAGSGRANISSWYLRPGWRTYGALLNQQALRRRDVSYINISPAPNTLPTIEALGFRRVTGGLHVGLTMPGTGPRGARVRRAAAAGEDGLLADHLRFGCFAVEVESEEGVLPFVFRRRFFRGWIPAAMLIACPSLAHVERYARTLSRALFRCGYPLLAASTPSPLRGFPGRHYPDRMPIYVRGELDPVPSDLAYTEAAIFGL